MDPPCRPDQRPSVADLPLTELASGVDALYLSGRPEVPGELLDRLEDGRQLAEGTTVPIPFDLGGDKFDLAPHGWGKYRYCLDHPDGRVGFTTSKQLPAVRVQLRSAFLHTAGPAGAVERFHALLLAECGELSFSVSRIDLYADFEGWDLSLEDRPRFVCRADSVRTYEAEGRLTGFDFGKRDTGTISARIYNKTVHVARTGVDWWFDVWDKDRQSSSTIHRVEFELNRKGLAQFGLLGPAETLASAGDLWRYGTTEWLTHRSPTADGNRARWPTSAEWCCVQRATLAQRRVGADRITSQLRCGSLRKLTPGLAGYLVSFAVLSGTSGIDDTVSALGHHLRQDELARGLAFSERIRRRRLEGGQHG
ncbi:MAG TPA: hypothetical protein VFA11_13965 [Acidimicrobiales bacterium]|nr:hypothetical protein [Acidimicrobiales bacterium]